MSGWVVGSIRDTTNTIDSGTRTIFRSAAALGTFLGSQSILSS